MTPREAFKLGFLQKCAADGLTNDETLARIQHAAMMLKAGEGHWWDPIANTAGGLVSLGLVGAGVIPPLLGVAGGAVAADATNHNYDAEEAKKREEIAEYQRAVKALKALHAKQQQMV